MVKSDGITVLFITFLLWFQKVRLTSLRKLKSTMLQNHRVSGKTDTKSFPVNMRMLQSSFPLLVPCNSLSGSAGSQKAGPHTSWRSCSVPELDFSISMRLFNLLTQ